MWEMWASKQQQKKTIATAKLSEQENKESSRKCN